MNVTVLAKSKKRVLVRQLKPGDLIECGEECLLLLDSETSYPGLDGVRGIPAVCLSDASITWLEKTNPVYVVFKISASCKARRTTPMRKLVEDVEEEYAL